jgi:serine/threonine protein kinase
LCFSNLNPIFLSLSLHPPSIPLPQNILLDTTGHIKVADFGFAKVVKNVTCSFCGTPDYIAAEIVIGKPYTKAVDWWSLGVLIFELTSGKTPFGDDSSERVYENIQVGKIKWHALIKGPVKEIISQLLVLNVTERLGSGATGGAAAIKAHAYFAKINWGKLEARQMTPPYTPNVLAPEIIEKERAAKIPAKDEVLDNIHKNNQQATSNGNWLGTGGYGDLFKNF